MGRGNLAGAAGLELVQGVAQLHPEDAMFEAMLRGWQAQQAARGLREETAGKRDRLVRRFMAFTGEYPWGWLAGHMDEWSLCLTSEEHLAPSTVRGYQGCLRQFTEFLTDARYGWVTACERSSARGTTRWRSAMSGTRSPISAITRAIPRRGRSPARRCSGSWIMPMTRWSGPRGRDGRGPWPPTATRLCSR